METKSVESLKTKVEGQTVRAKAQNPKAKRQRKSKGPISKKGQKASGKKDGAGSIARGRSLQTATRERGGLRAELVEVLEQFGVSVAGFDRLRSDAYEKQIAGRSLAELEQFYEVLLGPVRGYVEMMAACPKWGKDHKPPHWTTLQTIKERIMNEQSLREHLAAKGLLEARKVDGQGTDDEEMFSGEALEILAEELLVAKTKGKPISENLKIVDRLLKSAMIGIRQRRERREEAKFKWIQAGKPMVRPEPTGPVKPQETAEAMIERIYGKNPFKQEAEKTSVTAGPNMNHKDTEAQSTKFQNPESKLQGNSNNQAPMTEPTVKGTGNKIDNHEIPEIRETKHVEKKAGLPAWATKVGSIMIGAPSAKHPKGIKKCVITNLPVDVVTDEPALDVDWKTLIGFGGDGSNN